ncbi:MAG TPA: class I SAM-dependent methyltransferase [Acidimicrobiales bacterium]|nr:class I SAM-dependent methyltransferase [Acidimicrobiales bacterium]
MQLPEPFLEVPAVVANSAVLPTDRATALGAARGRLSLARCGSCGLVRNIAFDPEVVTYSADYDASQWASPRFRQFAEQLARDLVRDHALSGRTVLEIGCGAGEFLAVMRAAGVGAATGVDPSYVPARGTVLPRGVRILATRYPPPGPLLTAEAVVCRQTLEHLEDPGAFVASLRARPPEGMRVLYVDVPDATAVFAGDSTWDLVYQHVSYFEVRTLEALVASRGFRVEGSGRVFDGQFAFVAAVPEPDGGSAHAESAQGHEPAPDSGAGGTAELARRVDRARHLLLNMRASGRRVALWGAGSRGVTFLDLVDLEHVVTAVADVNPAKHGRFLPGSGHQVCAPDALVDLGVDVVLLTNPVYLDEVREMMGAAGLAASVEFV